MSKIFAASSSDAEKLQNNDKSDLFACLIVAIAIAINAGV